jgi:hypothetical protein
VLGDERDRATRRLARRIEPENLQGLQGVHRRRPGLPRLAAGVGHREQCAASPQPVSTLECQKAGEASVRSRSTCQRMAESESTNQSTTFTAATYPSAFTFERRFRRFATECDQRR